MIDPIHSSHNIRKDDDERDYCVLCAAYTPAELQEECLDSDPLLDIWLDDDLLDDDDDDWDKTHEVLEEGELPEDVMNEVGITSDSMHQLIKLNDEEKASFEEIAQFIEEYL